MSFQKFSYKRRRLNLIINLFLWFSFSFYNDVNEEEAVLESMHNNIIIIKRSDPKA